MNETLKFFEQLANCDPSRDNVAFTVINGEGYGEKAILSNGRVIHLSRQEGLLSSHCEELACVRDTGIINVANSLVYSERIFAGKKIVICGAGHVSMPIIRLAKMLGFHVTVIDDREMFIENARRAGADIVMCDSFWGALVKISGGSDTYFVVVTRGHRYDSECLRAILNKTYAYVGMMGSSRRVKIVREGLIADGYDNGAVVGIHSPIGLSINAETPEEIAISIMAEIIQVKNRNKESEFPEEILRDILGTGLHESLPGRKVLCTIVSKQGAGPRNVGTKMLYTSEGKSLGTIGGGLMEANVMKKAEEMFTQENPSPVLMRVNLTAGALSKEGEVCGGVIEIWIERIS